jgi:hypothetical protein
VDSLRDNVELTRETGIQAIKAGIAKSGDLMVVISGDLYGAGRNNQIRVEAIEEVPAGDDSKLQRLVSFVYAGENDAVQRE